jgi:cbb3-type cytochrome c oxidase subunit III
MKSTNAVCGVFFFFLGCSFLVSGCASHPVATEEANYPADKIDAQALFVENCSTCHGKNGRAHTFHGLLVGAQNLTKPKWQEDATDSKIVHAIKTGPSVMPAFEKKLSETEIEALAKYVRTLKQSD